jgi:hypothetical protein
MVDRRILDVCAISLTRAQLCAATVALEITAGTTLLRMAAAPQPHPAPTIELVGWQCFACGPKAASGLKSSPKREYYRFEPRGPFRLIRRGAKILGAYSGLQGRAIAELIMSIARLELRPEN